MKTFISRSMHQIDEWGTAIYARKGYHKQSSKIGLYIELYFNDLEDYENGMDFYFHKKEDVEEFIKDLTELKEEVWPECPAHNQEEKEAQS